jgi:hypothetical protein
MSIADRIVSVLLDGAGNVHFDVRQRTDLYEPLGKQDGKGRDLVRACPQCEAEYGADKQYPADVWISHAPCHRHAAQTYMQYMGFTREQAMEKVMSMPAPPDWQKIEGLTTLDSPNKPQGE